ncbi:NAD(P)-dependent oxidoreductase [Nocardia cyriacigeorgica]|uniref:NAD(P)-dependent oxidoreductase n=1 Tax=Nocardia cyriacigeorgica TaxID=135487 RepID=A0A6P1D7Y4_9NOCA|nr:NAD(P)-binding domain-containing protein [Nocardia cyriacigeorgica]NEW37767.1 NAD(P)-dependent oxidoreductase [Nocardia cyriacigeorgica]NEW45631.1 NAD(P)-dependent oxidoreductase [Nocardia cyriacigeorgica]NEW48848.1 NAD(P)-dependent oxidoreductase [Nocardia cyriacigeorgica]NEW56149.1 NAD(P)-dependent oxidoreductase [Nocardia cyriacigeorgica]
MSDTEHGPVTVLGLGAMGRAFAEALLAAGHTTTVWNRTPGKDTDLVATGATGAASAAEAVAASPVIIVLLLDHASVHDTLDPVAEQLAGRQVINLTSTTPEQARELASWASAHGIDYLDGGIMATPPMIGQPGASILYSGSQQVFDDNRSTLELLAAAEYFGADAGFASTYDFALLSVMYGMFGGFLNGVALLRSIGVSAQDFGVRAAAWATAMAQVMPMEGEMIDARAYHGEGQNIFFLKAAVDAIVRAGHDAGVSQEFLSPLQNVVNRQIADGHGEMSVLRTVEAIV